MMHPSVLIRVWNFFSKLNAGYEDGKNFEALQNPKREFEDALIPNSSFFALSFFGFLTLATITAHTNWFLVSLFVALIFEFLFIVAFRRDELQLKKLVYDRTNSLTLLVTSVISLNGFHIFRVLNNLFAPMQKIEFRAKITLSLNPKIVRPNVLPNAPAL